MANNLKGTFTNGRAITQAMRAEARRERQGEPLTKSPEDRSLEHREAMARIHAADAAAGRKPWNPQPRKRNR